MRQCRQCGGPLVRRPTEHGAAFERRIYCGRPCYWKSLKGRPKGPRRRPEGTAFVPCSCGCGASVAVTASRRRVSKRRLFYSSTECQARDRRRGRPLAVQSPTDKRLRVAEDAKTGRYSLRELAARHETTASAVSAALHREGIVLREVRRQHMMRFGGPALVARLDRVYRAHPTGLEAHGTMRARTAWFAGVLGRNVETVRRWIRGRTPIDAAALEVLGSLEREAGIS